MSNHFNSIRLETVCRSALNVNSRGALHGMVDADYIDIVGNALSVIAMALAPYYKNANAENRQRIEEFLNEFSHLGDTDYDKDSYSTEVARAAEELGNLLRTLE